MIVFTSIEHLSRRGVPASLTRRYGKDYQVVIVGPISLEGARRRVGKITRKRIIATIPTRDAISAWMRRHDGPGVPWPRYTIVGLEGESG